MATIDRLIFNTNGISLKKTTLIQTPTLFSKVNQIKSNLITDTKDEFKFGMQVQCSRTYPNWKPTLDPKTNESTQSWRVLDYQALKDMGISFTWEKYRDMDDTLTNYYRTQSLSAATEAGVKIFIDGYDDLILVKITNYAENLSPLDSDKSASALTENLTDFTETYDCFGGVQLIDEPCIGMDKKYRASYKEIYDEYRALVIANKFNIHDLGGTIYCNAFPAYASFEQLQLGNGNYKASAVCCSENSENEEYVNYLKAVVNPGAYLASIDPDGSKYNKNELYDETLTTDVICSNNFVNSNDEAICNVQKPFFRAMWKVKEAYPDKPLWNHCLSQSFSNFQTPTSENMKYQVYLNMACGMQQILFFGIGDKIASGKTSEGKQYFYYSAKNSPFDSFHQPTDTYYMMKELLTGEFSCVGSLVKNAEFVEHEFYSVSSTTLPSFISSITSGEIVASKITKNNHIYYLVFGMKDSEYTLKSSVNFTISKSLVPTILTKKEMTISYGDIQIFT